jgi:NAD+ synthase (glutamine-hydrolysing)
MKLVIAQLNLLVGGIDKNREKILDAAKSAAAVHADVLVTPELSICSYQPEDLLLRPSFIAACKAAVEGLAKDIAAFAPNLVAIVGLPWKEGDALYNSAAVLRGGAIESVYNKAELPNYSVFDDKRYFLPGQTPVLFGHQGKKIAVLICEDIWFDAPAIRAKVAGADALVVINGSPYDTEHFAAREQVCRDRTKACVLQSGRRTG